MNAWVTVAGASLVTGLILQPLLIPWLSRRGVVDVPNHRSSHMVATPRGGGIAVLVALGVGLLAADVGWQGWAVYLGCLLLGGLGLVDDFGDVDAKPRLAALLVVGGLAGLIFDSPLPTLAAIPAMSLWVAAYVNAFNFMDGINGISALSGIVAGVAYAAMGITFASSVLAALGAAILGACLSFLPFNLGRAKVFLGDVGSYGLGFAIAACAWLAWGSGAPLVLAISPTLVYLADTGWTLLRRARSGAPLLQAHREHTYQRLVATGKPHGHVALYVTAVSTVAVLVVALGSRSGLLISALSVAAVAVVIAGYLSAPTRPWVVHSQ